MHQFGLFDITSETRKRDDSKHRTSVAAKRMKATLATRKTSLYRLRGNSQIGDEDLRSFVVPKYLERDGFTNRRVDHEGIHGLLVSGTIAPGWADWCDPLGGLIG